MINIALEKYEAYKDSGVEWLGEVPVHWEVKRLKDFASIRGGKDFGSTGIHVVARAGKKI